MSPDSSCACTEWPIGTRFSRDISFNPPTLQCYFYTENAINPTSPHFGVKKRSLFRTFCSSADSSGTSARVRSVRQHLAAAEPFFPFGRSHLCCLDSLCLGDASWTSFWVGRASDTHRCTVSKSPNCSVIAG